MNEKRQTAHCPQCDFTTESFAMFLFHMEHEHGMKPHLATKIMERGMPDMLEALRLEGVEKKARPLSAEAQRRRKKKS
jgi:hypothetical protein